MVGLYLPWTNKATYPGLGGGTYTRGGTYPGGHTYPGLGGGYLPWNGRATYPGGGYLP